MAKVIAVIYPFTDTEDATWDAVVIGAGPAGCIVSRAIASAGHRVLLVEAKCFPREKVCGGCLSAYGTALLQQHGLLDAVAEAGPIDIGRVSFWLPKRHYSLAIPRGLSISRSALDAILLREAESAGVQTLMGVRAMVDPNRGTDSREIELTIPGGHRIAIRTKVAIAADGLGHPSLARIRRLASRVGRTARIGIGAIVESAHEQLPVNTITMVVDRQGYFGISHCEAGRLSIAAAVDASLLSTYRSPAAVIDLLLRRSCLKLRLDTTNIPWSGTRPLTQSSADVADQRVFIVGDAASYIEPLTGEGMASAIAAATAVAPLAIQVITSWDEPLADRWRIWNRHCQRRRQRACRLITRAVRTPWVADLGLRAVCGISPLGRAVANHLHGPVNV